MLLTLSDILFTAFASGLVTLVAGAGIAALPWRDQELTDVDDALQVATRLPRQWLHGAATPVPAVQTRAIHS